MLIFILDSVSPSTNMEHTLFSPHKIRNNDIFLEILIMGQKLERVKYLGVIVDNELKFDAHINKLRNKISKYVALFYIYIIY